MCFICENVVAIVSKSIECGDAPFYEGLCQARCHKQYIGRSNLRLQLYESDDPFIMFAFLLVIKNIVDLPEQVKSLTSEIGQLKLFRS